MSFGDYVPMHDVKLEHGYACRCRLAYSCLGGVRPSESSLMNRAGGGHAMIVNSGLIGNWKMPEMACSRAEFISRSVRLHTLRP